MSETALVSSERREELVVASVHCARMDEDLTRKMRTEVAAVAEGARPLPLVLDMSEVEFVPSLSLGALVELHRELKQNDQRLVLVGLHPDVRGGLAVTRLDKLFDICDDVNEALTHLR